MKRVAFITNLCSHYRVKTFESLAGRQAVDFYFFSAGRDWYWQQENGLRSGKFQYEYLHGFYLGKTRVTPELPGKLMKGGYDVYVKCINGRFALPVSYLVARIRRKPFILWTGVWMRLQSRFHRVFFPITRYIYRHADGIVVYGEHVRRYLVEEGVPPRRLFVAPQSVDNDACGRPVSSAEKQAVRIKCGLDDRTKIVLYVGRLEESKGLRYLVEAMASLSRTDTVLLLVGTGLYEGTLRTLAQQLNVTDRLRFIGYVAPEETATYYAVAWTCVLPSITTPLFKEPWGLVVNEAFNQGVPVIATQAVGAVGGGLLVDGKNGVVVPERDSVALAAALRRILASRAFRDRLGREARRLVAKWTPERTALGFVEAIKYVTRRPA